MVLSKDSLRIIMGLVTHYNLELVQMDVKTAFVNEQLFEEIICLSLRVLRFKVRNVWYVN